jgi:membrane protein
VIGAGPDVPPLAGRRASGQRPLYVTIYWTLRDYAKRVWDNSGEDNVLFLAGGVAFNIILAVVPFALLMVTGLTYVLPSVAGAENLTSIDAVTKFLDQLLPTHAEGPNSAIHTLLVDILNTRGAVSLYGTIAFIWFSTRLFGSLRTVLANVFDIEHERGIIAGKLFDIKITVIATLLFVASSAVTTYIAFATTRGVSVLVRLGLRDDVMGQANYWFGRAIASAILGMMFFALYKYLPIRRVRTRTAWVATLFCLVMFEGARIVFARYVGTFNPASMYSGLLEAIVIIVVWCYYAALIFILGGEVGQVYELRRVRRLQHQVFVD